MPAEVQASKILGLSKGQHRSVFRNPRGNKRYYAVYIDPESPFDLQYEWSSNGTTWTNSPIDIVANWSPVSFDVKIFDDGSQLEVRVVFTSVSTIRYVYGVISDSSDTINWNSHVEVTDPDNAIMSEEYCVAIARTDNGELVVAYTEDFNSMGKDYRRTYLIGSDGDGAAPSWGTAEMWDDPSTDNNNDLKGDVWFGLESFSSSFGDRVLLVGFFPHSTSSTFYRVTSAVPDWGGSSFSNTTPQNLNTGIAASVVALLIDEGDISYAALNVAGTTILKTTGTAGNDNWTSSDTISSSAVDALTIALDTGPATDELYAFYHHSADSTDFHYKTTPIDSISWGSEQTISFRSDLIALTSWSRTVENSLHIGIEDGDTDVHYFEVTVFKALSTTLADLVFPDQNYYIGPFGT